MLIASYCGVGSLNEKAIIGQFLGDFLVLFPGKRFYIALYVVFEWYFGAGKFGLYPPIVLPSPIESNHCYRIPPDQILFIYQNIRFDKCSMAGGIGIKGDFS
jgi:hypothetical protein